LDEPDRKRTTFNEETQTTKQHSWQDTKEYIRQLIIDRFCERPDTADEQRGTGWSRNIPKILFLSEVQFMKGARTGRMPTMERNLDKSRVTREMGSILMSTMMRKGLEKGTGFCARPSGEDVS